MSKNFKSPLSKAIGHGSAKTGSQHWWWQRITAILLVPLWIWFIYSLTHVLKMDYENIYQWLQSPLVCSLMIIMLASLYYHAILGMQVIIEDYIESEWRKIASILLVNFLILLMGTVSVISVLKIFLSP